MTTPDPSAPICYGSHAAIVRPTISPIGRRDTIRDSLDQGNWQQAAQHLHEAHAAREWRGCGIRCWRDYTETLGITRRYADYLRLTWRTGTAQAVPAFGSARRLAQQAQQG